MVGFPRNLHALYVEQLEGTDGALSVLDTVMQADREVQTWRQQAALLQVANFAIAHVIASSYHRLLALHHVPAPCTQCGSLLPEVLLYTPVHSVRIDA